MGLGWVPAGLGASFTGYLADHTSLTTALTALIVAQALSRQMSLVFCTHWFDIVKRDCTRVIGLQDGRILFDLPPDQVSSSQLDQLYAGSGERI